jgi:hypothetical protein
VKKPPKRPVSPFAGYVSTTPEMIEADKPLISCRVALSIDNVHDSKSVPAPAYSNKKSGKSAK